MSKRGLEPLRTAFFQAAFSAAQHDPELKAFYRRKRSQNKCHHVALSHLMRILTRRLVAVLRSDNLTDLAPISRLQMQPKQLATKHSLSPSHG